MGISGQDFVASMSQEMAQWIKDTSILWVKNKGAGQKTSEKAIAQEKSQNNWEQEKKQLI